MGIGCSGKTARDRANGCHQRNASNKAERTVWMNGGMRKPDGSNPFPSHTCNGKKNRLVKR